MKVTGFMAALLVLYVCIRYITLVPFHVHPSLQLFPSFPQAALPPVLMAHPGLCHLTPHSSPEVPHPCALSLLRLLSTFLSYIQRSSFCRFPHEETHFCMLFGNYRHVPPGDSLIKVIGCNRDCENLPRLWPSQPE